MTRRSDRFTDTFDRFQPRERGRFGDNEMAPPRGGRVTGASDLVDVTLIYLCTLRSGKAMGFGHDRKHVGPPIYLPLSQIECEPKPTMNGQAIAVTLPQWMAKQKGLI